MREILFRGKSKNSQKWRVGNLAQTLIYGEYYCRITVDDGNISSYLVKNETVGQYTGVNDKNGVKIFEWDIVKLHMPEGDYIGIVEYKYGCPVIVNKGWGFYMWMDCEREVIGNKFDNPELMEQIIEL